MRNRRQILAKSQPAPGDVYVSRPLTSISLAYSQEEDAHIADKMFQVVPSDDQGGIYWEWDSKSVMRNEMKTRAPNAPTAEMGMKLNQKTYFCMVYGLHQDIPDQRRANERSPINSDRAATRVLTYQAMQYREITLKAVAFGTGKWTGMADQVGAASVSTNQFIQWDRATSTPVANVKSWITTTQLTKGVRPNTIAMGQQVWDGLMTNPDIIDRIKYGQTPGKPAIVTMAAVAALFGVNEILVSSVVQDTAAENVAASNAYVIGKELVLFYKPPAPAIDTPAAGYTITWRGYMGATDNGVRMKKFRIEANAADRIEIEQSYIQTLTASALGMYASSVVQ